LDALELAFVHLVRERVGAVDFARRARDLDAQSVTGIAFSDLRPHPASREVPRDCVQPGSDTALVTAAEAVETIERTCERLSRQFKGVTGSNTRIRVQAAVR
jgi:hypothetical protein